MKLAMVALVLVVLLAVLGFWVLRGRAPVAPLQPPRAVTPETVQAALAPYQKALEASRRPVLRIRLEDFPADELLASKVGGRAWWPEGTPPPTGSKGAPLVLLAQLNFAELPASPDYPSQGLLQFYIAADDVYGADFDAGPSVDSLSRQRNFRVVYWRETDVASITLVTASDEEHYTPHDPGQPRRMHFTAGSEVVSSSDYRFDRMLAGDPGRTLQAWATANGYDEDVIGAVYDHLNGAGHKFGGYPYFTQTDPRSDGPLELLLQLDSDDHMMWGDVGVGGFFIAPADLAKGDFSHVLYSWDCH